MALTGELISILRPVAARVADLMEERDSHDPLALMQERLLRLIDALEHSPPTVDRMKALQELGFLREHSLNEELASLHAALSQATDTALTGTWE